MSRYDSGGYATKVALAFVTQRYDQKSKFAHARLHAHSLYSLMPMPYTVAVSFEKFYENINLDGDFRSIANTRRDDIVKMLEKNFTIVEAFSTGFIPKFTALKSAADVDVMVAPMNQHQSRHINRAFVVRNHRRQKIGVGLTGIAGTVHVLHHAGHAGVHVGLEAACLRFTASRFVTALMFAVVHHAVCPLVPGRT